MKYTNILFGRFTSLYKAIPPDFIKPKKPRRSASRRRKMWYRRWQRMQIWWNYKPLTTEPRYREWKRKIRRTNAWKQKYFGILLHRLHPFWNLHMLVGMHSARYLKDDIKDLYKNKYGLKLRHLSTKNLRWALIDYEPRKWDVVYPCPKKRLFSYSASVFFLWSMEKTDLDYFLKSAHKHLVWPYFYWVNMRTGLTGLWVNNYLLKFYFTHFLYNDNKFKLLIALLGTLFFPFFFYFRVLFHFRSFVCIANDRQVRLAILYRYCNMAFRDAKILPWSSQYLKLWRSVYYS